jgi:hypothetical protein
MKRNLYIITIFWCAALLKVNGQSDHFTVRTGSGEMQVKGTANGTLAFFFVVYYHADLTKAPYTGYIRPEFITGKYSIPQKSIDSVDVTTLPQGQLNDGDSIPVYGHFKITDTYFRNGSNNLIVIWPTGAKSGNTMMGSSDSIHYPKNITISGLTGVEGDKNAFNPVRIFPNPANNILNIELTDPALKPQQVRVLDLSGKELLRTKENLDRIDVSLLKSGTYFLEIYFRDQRKATYSFIINK